MKETQSLNSIILVQGRPSPKANKAKLVCITKKFVLNTAPMNLPLAVIKIRCTILSFCVIYLLYSCMLKSNIIEADPQKLTPLKFKTWTIHCHRPYAEYFSALTVQTNGNF